MFDRALNICPEDKEEQNQVHSKLLEDTGKVPVLETASSGPIQPYIHELYNRLPSRIGSTDFSDSSNLMAQGQIVDMKSLPLTPSLDLLEKLRDADQRLKSEPKERVQTAPGGNPGKLSI